MSEQLISISSLHESPFNYRRTFDDADLQELAASIKAEGILQPLLARPRIPPLFADMADAADTAACGFEIVFGHRRFRAAQLAGLESVRCMVRTMSDEQVKRAQIAENLQRKDVHAIEEAEGFRALIDEHGLTADQIFEQVGKSKSYVYGRLKLLEACEPVRSACLVGEIGSETALLFARQKPELQVKALEKLKGTQFYRARNGYTDGGKEGYRAIRDFLNEYFMLDLKAALWQLDDAELLPSAGACTNCPKRSGCSPELFSDVVGERSGYRSKGGEHVCTDPDCFADKKTAHLKRAAAALVAQGKVVITGGKARQIISAEGDVKGGYVEASKVRDLIKKAKADVVIATAQNPRDGKTKQVVKIEDLKAAGVKIAEPKPKSSSDSGKWERERAARDKKAEEETKIRKSVLLQVHTKLRATDRSVFDLQILARSAIESMDYDGKDLLQELQGCETWQQLEDSIATLSANDLACLMLDIALAYQVEPDGWDLQSGRAPAVALFQAAEHYGIDVDQVRAEVTGKAQDPKPAAQAQPKAANEKTNAARAAAKGKVKKAAVTPFDDNAPIEPELANEEQTDDAGVAGGSAAQVDAFEDVELEA